MRQLLLDELSADDVSVIRDFLKANAIESGVTDLFWVELSQDLLNPGQYEARDDQPFCFAAEVGESWVKFEFLIRSRLNFSSLHTCYASQPQLDFILKFSNRLIEQFDIKT